MWAIRFLLLCLLVAGCSDADGMMLHAGRPAVAAPPSCLTDNFTAVNGTGLEIYDANYTSINAGENVEDLEINSNAVEPEGTYRDGGAYYNDGGGAASGTTYTSAVVAYQSGSSIGLPYITSRAGNNELGYACRLYFESGGNWTRLAVYESGVSIGSYASVSFSTATSHTLYLKVTDNGGNADIECWVDDSTGIADESETDSPRTINSGYPGFYYSTSSNVIWSLDDFSDCAF